MKITWSIPVWGERYDSSRGDLVRARSLIEALQADGHEVRVVENSARAGAALTVSMYRRVLRRVLPQRLGLVLRDFGRWMHARGHGRRVAAEARKQDAEVIMETHVNFAGSGALAASITGLPLVLDDWSPSSEEEVLGAGLPALARCVLQRQIQAASVIVAVSQVMRQRLIEAGASSDKLVIVPNGVHFAAYDAADRDASRERLKLADRWVLGFAGSFQPWHQVELLVEALARLVNNDGCHLLLVGDGPGLKSAFDAARRLGLSCCVRAVGAVAPSQVPELISSFDVGVLPGSNDYGHPMKLLEYAAAGLPSVAPDLAPVREILQDGMTGLLFRPGDVNALAMSLARLKADKNLCRRLGESARRRVGVGEIWMDRARTLVSHVIPAAHGAANRLISPV